MEALYRRALARVPTPQLHDLYNAVLQEEFGSASQVLDDVLTAFAKLEEVHNAVSKLQQCPESSPDGHSESLRASAEETMGLQQLLQRRVESLAAGLQVAEQERKRKRVDEEAATAPSAHSVGFNGGNAVDMASSNAAINNVRRLAAGADPGSDSESSEEEMDTSVQKLKCKESVVGERKVAAASGPASSFSSESESDEDSDEVEGSEAAWKALITNGGCQSSESDAIPGPANEAESARAPTKPLRKMATYMKTVVEIVNTFSPLDRSFITSEVLAALKESVEEDVDGVQQSEVTSSLKLVVSWGDRHKGYQVQHVDLLYEYAAVVKSYVERLPSSAQISELERLKDSLSSLTKTLDDRVFKGRKPKPDFVATVKDAKKRRLFSQIVGDTYRLPQEERLENLLRVLVAFKQETAGNVCSSFGDRMIKVIGKMSRWLTENFRDPIHLLVYRIILDAFREFSNRIPKITTRDRVVGLLETMSEGIADPTSARVRERLMELRIRARQLLSEVEKYQGKSISSREAHTLEEAARVLVENVTVGWCPHEDVVVRKCVQTLESILVAQAPSDIKRGRSFEACIAKIAKWKIKGLQAAVEAERKRKRVDEDIVMVSSVATPVQGRDVDGVKCNAAAKKAKSEESSDSSVVSDSSESSSSSESDSDGDGNESDEGEEEEGREAARKTLVPAGNHIGVMPNGTLETQSMVKGSVVPDVAADDSVVCVKAIVEEANNMSPLDRSFIISDVLAALKESVEEDTDGLQPSEVSSSLNALVGWWAGQCEDQMQHLRLYRECAAVMETYVGRLPMSTQKSELTRLLSCLLSAIKNFGAMSNRRSKRHEAIANNRASKKTTEFSNVVGKADTQSYSDRKRMLLRILVAFKQDTAADVDAAYGKQMLKATGRICRWLSVDPREWLQLRQYRMLVKALRQFSGRISEALTRVRVVRLLENMSDVLADPSSSKTHKNLVDLRNRAAQVYQDVKRFQGTSVTKKESHKLMNAVGLLAKDATIGWNPRRDATMRKCVKELKTILVRARASGGADSKQYYIDCLGAIANWKIEDPPAVVRAPTQ